MGLYPETEHNPTPRVLYISPEIREWPQWVIWRWGEMREDGSYQKIPISPLTGVAENYNDPATWGSLGKAQMVIRKYGCDGIGFVLTWEDPYTVIDLDDCRNPETGEVLQRGMRQVRRFDSLTLVSPSGRGLQIWVKGKLPVGRFNKKAEYGIEGYSAGQFMTYSGEVFHDAPIRDSQSALTALYGSLYPAEGEHPRKPQ